LLVPSTQAEYSPAFSPDGHKLAFISDRSGTADIWISAPDGGQPRKLTSLREGDLPMSPSWSPDGTRIAFFCRRNGLNYAYETQIASGVTRPLRGGEDYALFPQYSSDGKSLYYVSNVGHRFRIWRELLDAGAGAEPAVADEVRLFRLSKDRRYIYFFQDRHPERLIRMNLATKEESTVWTFTDSLAAFDAWDVAGASLFYVCQEASRRVPQLVAVDLDSGERRILGPLRKLSHEWQTSIAASPDGQSVVITQVDSDDTRLMLMQLGQ
jgi:TolB protein